MSGINALQNFIISVKNEYEKPLPTSHRVVYQKVLKELTQSERKMLYDIISNPNVRETNAKKTLALKIRTLDRQIQDDSQTFKSRRKTGWWSSFCRIMSNIFENRTSSNKLQRAIINSPNLKDIPLPTDDELLPHRSPDPIRYKKGEQKTQEVIPRDKPIGKGKGNPVYEHGKADLNRVVKKGEVNEYEMGAILNHPNLTKIHNLYIKEYDDGKAVNRFDMDKIEGRSLDKYHLSNDVISNELAIKLLEQAKDCCGYLFEEGVIWRDVNCENLFIEDGSKNLKIIDFGYWEKIENPKERAMLLLLGAMEISGWLVKNAACTKTSEKIKDRELAKKIMFPKKFFNEQIDLNQINMLNTPEQKLSWMTYIDQKMAKMNEYELENFVKSYFDHVIAGISKAPSR